MVNKDSQLYQTHPDWLLAVPEWTAPPWSESVCFGYSRPEVVDEILSISAVIEEAQLDYIKWDMNRLDGCLLSCLAS